LSGARSLSGEAELERVSVVDTDEALHLRYRVVK
jgi:hypothetical protein